MSSPQPILVLGMHRSGTSCLAGMLAAGGLASAGEAVRNWDNARGHHEMLDAVRLDEAVLAYSGGHWLLAPAKVRWTDEHAAARDRLLQAQIDGRPALIKDPRTLIVLPFWRASRVPYRVIGIVRHPLSVARSLESWRATPLVEGIALWTAHNRALLADLERHADPLIDFEQPRDAVIEAVLDACAAWGSIDERALAAAYEDQLVHHDPDDAPDVDGLAEAVALYEQLATIARKRRAIGAARRSGASEDARSGGGSDLVAAQNADAVQPSNAASRFPRTELATFARLLDEGAVHGALDAARAALASARDAAAVLVPIVTALVKHRALVEARAAIAEQAPRLDDGLADLLDGKVLLAMGDATGAVARLEASLAVEKPFFQARHLLPQALRGAGRHAEAREALRGAAAETLYPHGPLATLAEWSWLDGERDAAIAEMARAIEAAPPHRRGRLRTRRAEWLIATGEHGAARAELERAIAEDPAYSRSRDVLRRLG